MSSRVSAVYSAVAMVVLMVPSAMDVAYAGPEVNRVGNLYQWVDQSGRVIYGDSPPTVTQSRRVDERVVAGVQRNFSDASTDKPRNPTAPTGRQGVPGLNAAQLAALARLQPELAQALREAAVARSTSQPDSELDSTAELVPAASEPASPTPRIAAAAAGSRSIPSASQSAVPQSDRLERTPLAEPAAEIQTASVPAPSNVAPVPAPEQPEVPTPGSIAAVVSSPSSVNLGLTTATVVDVAQAKPQLIETELSEKERVRMRRRSQAIGEQRFLDRLRNFRAPPAN